jgi:hypothetical protein
VANTHKYPEQEKGNHADWWAPIDSLMIDLIISHENALFPSFSGLNFQYSNWSRQFWAFRVGWVNGRNGIVSIADLSHFISIITLKWRERWYPHVWNWQQRRFPQFYSFTWHRHGDLWTGLVTHSLLSGLYQLESRKGIFDNLMQTYWNDVFCLSRHRELITEILMRLPQPFQSCKPAMNNWKDRCGGGAAGVPCHPTQPNLAKTIMKAR